MATTDHAAAAKEEAQKLREKHAKKLEASLWEFAKYVCPNYMYGDIHKQVFDFWQQVIEEKDPSEILKYLLLLPREHLKSHTLAVAVSWIITKWPWITIVYVSAGEDLATVQIYAIKNILTSDKYRLLWPTMFEKREGDRDRWTTWAINTDHPDRKTRQIRDFTLIIKTVKGNATGLHADFIIFDDLVVPGNAYSKAGRKDVDDAVAEFTAIRNAGAKIMAAGTRYHEKDMYGKWIEAEEPVWSEEKHEFTHNRKAWKVMHRLAEDAGDGTGVFLWPRVQNPATGEWYGFDPQTLASKKAELIAIGKYAYFNAQYYNDPNSRVKTKEWKEKLQYYNKKYLDLRPDGWYIDGRKLKLMAAMDCAWTDDTGSSSHASDYTAIAVVGVTEDGFYYILDLVQFKTSQFLKYYQEIEKLQRHWGFRKIWIETNSAGKLIKQEVQNHVRQAGISLSVMGQVASASDGAKAERWAATLDPKYDNGSVYHYEGGYMPEYEEQLSQQRPRKDDLKDAVTIAFSKLPPPSKAGQSLARRAQQSVVASATTAAHSRFGGRRVR